MSSATGKKLAERLVQKIAPDYRPPSDIYQSQLQELVQNTKIWLDLGCGNADFIVDFQHLSFGVGVDLRLPIKPTMGNAPFVLADMYHLPFQAESCDLVALRFVVEHLANIESLFAEMRRVIKTGGQLLIYTTNRASPLVFLPNLLPFQLKKWLIQKLFGVDIESVFPTFHKFNTPGIIKHAPGGFALVKTIYLDGISFDQWSLFLPSLVWYMLTRPGFMEPGRVNLLAVYQRVADN